MEFVIKRTFGRHSVVGILFDALAEWTSILYDLVASHTQEVVSVVQTLAFILGAMKMF
jgi:hypothetical protein